MGSIFLAGDGSEDKVAAAPVPLCYNLQRLCPLLLDSRRPSCHHCTMAKFQWEAQVLMLRDLCARVMDMSSHKETKLLLLAVEKLGAVKQDLLNTIGLLEIVLLLLYWAQMFLPKNLSVKILGMSSLKEMEFLLLAVEISGDAWCCQKAGYAPYSWTSDDRVAIAGLGKSAPAKKAVCESLGHVFTQGYDVLAPGCGDAWCCQKMTQVNLEQIEGQH